MVSCFPAFSWVVPFIAEGVRQVLRGYLMADIAEVCMHLRGSELPGVLQGEDPASQERGPYPLLLIVQVSEILLLPGIPGLVNRAPVVGCSELLPGLPGVGRKFRAVIQHQVSLPGGEELRLAAYHRQPFLKSFFNVDCLHGCKWVNSL